MEQPRLARKAVLPAEQTRALSLSEQTVVVLLDTPMLAVGHRDMVSPVGRLVERIVLVRVDYTWDRNGIPGAKSFRTWDSSFLFFSSLKRIVHQSGDTIMVS